MKWRELKELFEKMENEDVFKAIIYYEEGIENEEDLDKLYNDFLKYNYNLLNENIEDAINEILDKESD